MQAKRNLVVLRERRKLVGVVRFDAQRKVIEVMAAVAARCVAAAAPQRTFDIDQIDDARAEPKLRQPKLWQSAFLRASEQAVELDLQEIANMTRATVAQVRRFGMEPKVALLSHSNFGSHDSESAVKMREALALIQQRHPELEIDGEMHGDAALDEVLRNRVYPNSNLKGAANVLIMPSLDAANIATLLIKIMADALPVGPMLVGAAKPAHILTPSVTARGIVNMTALSVVEAQQRS